MKNLLAALTILIALTDASYAQNINWRSLRDDQPNIIQCNLGYDYGATVQLGFSRFDTLIRPVVVGADIEFPMGSDLIDDFKVRLGGQVEIVELDGFAASVRIMSNFRRYENSLVRIVSFGSDFGLVAGYYGSWWYAAGEFGFDKAITSHLKHSALMKSNFPGIRDGWYIPTGGHYYYGVQGGATIGGAFDLSLRMGLTSAQDNDEDAAVPAYLQLGLGVRF